MPVFFFVSGYLINIDKLRCLSITQLVMKYWKRMLAMWCVAWIVYTSYIQYGDYSLKSLIANIYLPYYHLWFIPSLFVIIVIVWGMAKCFKDGDKWLYILFLIGVLLFNLSNTPFSISKAWNCAMLPFFVLGLISNSFIRNIRNYNGGRFIWLYFMIIFAINNVLDNTIQFFCSYIMLPLVSLLCIVCVLPILKNGKLHNKTLEYWGQNSLTIYLWHPIPILIIKKLWENQSLVYYLVSSIVMIIWITISHYKSKVYNSK